jgi:GNAT superfamily N-acetyltransferase
MTANQIKIRKCNLSDVDSIRYLQPKGWDDITFYFRFYCNHVFCYPIVAEYDDRIVGVANGNLNENTGWLAHIIVAEDCRNIGIGYLVTNHIINYLHDKGCKSLLLIATEMGEGLYRKFGFETIGEYIFFQGKRLTDNFSLMNIREFNQTDLKAILDLDKLVTGENRNQMLQQFLSNAWVYLTDSLIRGFFLKEFGEGTIIAADDEAGIALLTFKHHLSDGKSVLPDGNRSGIKYLKKNNFNNFLRAPRMSLGEPVEWKPEGIFSRAGGFYG